MKNLSLIRFLAAGFGVCFALIGMVGVWKGFESRGWPSAPAKIVKSERIGSGSHQSSSIDAEFRVGPHLRHCGRVRMERDNTPRDVKDFRSGPKPPFRPTPETNRRREVLTPVPGPEPTPDAGPRRAIAVSDELRALLEAM